MANISAKLVKELRDQTPIKIEQQNNQNQKNCAKGLINFILYKK